MASRRGNLHSAPCAGLPFDVGKILLRKGKGGNRARRFFRGELQLAGKEGDQVVDMAYTKKLNSFDNSSLRRILAGDKHARKSGLFGGNDHWQYTGHRPYFPVKGELAKKRTPFRGAFQLSGGREQAE